MIPHITELIENHILYTFSSCNYDLSFFLRCLENKNYVIPSIPTYRSLKRMVSLCILCTMFTTTVRSLLDRKQIIKVQIKENMILINSIQIHQYFSTATPEENYNSHENSGKVRSTGSRAIPL